MHVPSSRVLVPPARINTGGEQANNKRTFERLLPRFLHPSANLPAVRRVHKHLAFPRVTEPVIDSGEETRALGVLACGARIEREVPEDSLQLVEQGLRCFPFARGA